MSSFLDSMRSNLLVLLTGCIIAFFVSAQSFTPTDVALMGQLGAAEGAGCATTDTTLPHDELLEGFGTPGYEQSWTEVGTVANINDSADSSALSSGKPDGACDTACYFDVPTDGTETFIRWNRGSAFDIDAADLDFYMYIYVSTRPDAGETIQVVSIREYTGGSTVVGMFLSYSSDGGGQLRLQGTGASNSDVVVITEDAWHKVKIHMDTTVASCYFQVDDGSELAFNRGTDNVQYVLVGGAVSVDANDSAQFYLDLICLDAP